MRVMFTYADHNFLIDCANNPGWRRTVITALAEGRITIVLSPWSIYEIANTTEERMEELIQIVADFQPAWIPERADIQLLEGMQEWNRFWGLPPREFRPIGSLAQAFGRLHRCDPDKLSRFMVRDYAIQFRGAAREAYILPALREQQFISGQNHLSYVDGRLTREVEMQSKLHYVARFLARSQETGPSRDRLDERTKQFLTAQPLATQIWFFVEFGGMQEMKARKVEAMLTARHWESTAILNPNRQVDRQHAVAALAYCNYFVTSDAELIRRCSAIKDQLPFQIAEVRTGAEFIHFLAPPAAS
jgi:hypothetical protein